MSAAELQTGVRVRARWDLTTQPEGYPEMVVVDKGTEGTLVCRVAGKDFEWDVLFDRSNARGIPQPTPESVWVKSSEIEVVE